jgi:SMC interacting uncharacterized protein involved in chromosome segregation
MDIELLRERYDELSKAYEKAFAKYHISYDRYNEALIEMNDLWIEYKKISNERDTLLTLIKDEQKKINESKEGK